MTKLFLGFLLVGVFAAAATAADDDLAARLQALYRASDQAEMAGDVERSVAILAPDYVLYWPNDPVNIGFSQFKMSVREFVATHERMQISTVVTSARATGATTATAQWKQTVHAVSLPSDGAHVYESESEGTDEWVRTDRWRMHLTRVTMQREYLDGVRIKP